MKSETLVQQLPPTPPNVNSELQSGLQHIAQYNANRSYSFDEAHPRSSSFESSRASAHETIPQHSTQSFHSSQSDGRPEPDFGLGIHYVSDSRWGRVMTMLTETKDGYGQGATYYQDRQFNGMPVRLQYRGWKSKNSLTQIRTTQS